MSITQGAPLPDITTTETKAQAVPSYYTDYLQDISQAGQTAMGRSAAEGIAAYDPLQTLGYGQVETAAGAYRPGLTAAGQTAAAAAGGIDPTRISALMDPYQQAVVDEMARLQQRNIQQSVLPSLKGAFVGSGGLGGQRYAAATGQTLAEMQRNLMGQQTGALSSGYQNALKAALDELQIRNQAAQTQAKIAQQEQELGLTGAGALTKAGAERQAYEQSILDYPLKQATAAAGLMRGYQVPISTTETFKGPKAGVYQQSPLANILGVLSTLGSIRPGSVTYDKDGKPIASDSLLKMGMDYLKNLNFPVFGSSGEPLSAEEAADWWGGFDITGKRGGLASIRRR
jgi:hypothetical protein